jgi:hypothetical protein
MKDRQRGILGRIQAWEGRCSTARLFHLEGINASRWRNANMPVERMGDSVGFFPIDSLFPVALRSPGALGI